MAAHEPATCDARRPRYDLRFLFTTLTLAAVWLSLLWITTLASQILLAVYALTYLFGCWKTRRAVVFVLPAMYLPYAWLLFAWPWHDYRWQWITQLWQLPGMLAEVAIHPSPPLVFALVTSLTTLALFFCAIFAARLSLRAAWITCLVTGLASLANSLLCYTLFRA
jgi:hypothetical protein